MTKTEFLEKLQALVEESDFIIVGWEGETILTKITKLKRGWTEKPYYDSVEDYIHQLEISTWIE